MANSIPSGDSLDPVEFCTEIKASKDWEHFSSLHAARASDDSYRGQLLSAIASVNDINTYFRRVEAGEYVWLVDAVSGQRAVFHVVGFVNDVKLGPFTRELGMRSGFRNAPHRIRQVVSLTGLDDPQFCSEAKALGHINHFLSRSTGNMKPSPPTSTFGGRFPTICASSRLLTPSQYNIFETETEASLIMSDSIDPDGFFRREVSTGAYAYTSDNYVDLQDMRGIDAQDNPSSWSCEPMFSPLDVVLGDLVELSISFRVAPLGKSSEVQCHLERVTKLSSHASTRLQALRDNNKQMSLALTLQHREAKRQRAIPRLVLPGWNKRKEDSIEDVD
ncbi:hypothetical protein C8F01DRAFT_1374329 [Mycena amicta]|nr:hypothetical protein C8F01DRAFT_1374329 [Mycena amicta]